MTAPLEAEVARLRAERDARLGELRQCRRDREGDVERALDWQARAEAAETERDSARDWHRTADGVAIKASERAEVAEARVAELEAERDQAQEAVDYWRGRVGVQIDRIDRAVTERTEAIATWLRHIDRLGEIVGAGLPLPEHNPLWDAASAIEREFLAPTRTQEVRCGKPIEDDCPCALDAGHDGPCWPGHSWG